MIYEYYFGDEHRRKIESNLIVTQLGSITLKGVGKKQAVGTSVKEGQCKLNHFYSVVRDNKTIHHDLNVLSFQSNKLNVKSLLKGGTILIILRTIYIYTIIHTPIHII